MKGKYDYYCEANDTTLEAEHSWSTTLRTWGELTDLLGIDPDNTPRNAPIIRLIPSPNLFIKRGSGADGEDDGERLRPMSSGLHPMGCACGCIPTSPAIEAYQQKLLRMMKKKGENRE